MAESTDLQGVLGRFLPAYAARHGLDARRREVCGHLLRCRTAAMGALSWRCDACDYQHTGYLACRDRHCPGCQQRASRRWCQREAASVLEVTYYHVVFTVPHGLNGWASCHPEVVYRSLFAAAWGTVKAFAADPRRLDGEAGMSAVLHTWGQRLDRHIHLHCLIPGGALGAEGCWHHARGHYLFPVRALARHYRGGLVSPLRAEARAGALAAIAPAQIDARFAEVMGAEALVYAKPCLGGHTARVVEYLGRYSHRIAISNARILGMDAEGVRFRYTDHRDGCRPKVACLAGEEFVRRYLLHVLPKGFMRIRHFGFLANRHRRAKLAAIRAALAQPPPAEANSDAAGATEHPPCPACRKGHLHAVHLSPRAGQITNTVTEAPMDTG